MANIGIDLGTTNSLVAVVMSGKARCLLDEAGKPMLPSVVRYEAAGVAPVVGVDALEQAPQFPGRTFSSTKRFMGRAPADCAEDARIFRYRMDDAEPRFVRFLCEGHAPVTPVEVASEVLKTLKARAVECLFGEPGGAVITVPAYFDDAQRQATKDAARLAGIEVLRLLNEPTAAAIAYGLDQRASGKFAVYDLGGGTFDVSILDLNDGIFQVLATAGDTHLGGDDFDRALAALVFPDLASRSDSDARSILSAAESAKRALSAAGDGGASADLEGHGVSRTAFEQAIAPIVARTTAACRQALADAGLTAKDVDAVVLVGGSTRVPYVRKHVAELFGREPFSDLNPDEVVAIGAAMQADILTGSSQLSDDLLLLDVIPLSLGLEVMGGIVEKFIPRCSPIPISASQTFTTHADGQTGIDLHILQGDRELARDNRSLGRFTLKGLPRLPAGIARIKVDFLVDADGILRVSAKEEFTGIETQIEVKPSYGLTEEEIENMLEASIDHAETDVEDRMLIEARVEAEGILHALDKALAADRDMLTDAHFDRISAVAEALRSLHISADPADRKRISELAHELDEVSATFAQARIERDLTLALSGRAADTVGAELGLNTDGTRAGPPVDPSAAPEPSNHGRTSYARS